MILSSGNNIYKVASDFISNSNEITVFSAYIKLNQLQELNTNHNIKRIIVRWEIKDLCLGVSDHELFQYCKDNDISLYRNTRLHAKVIWNNQFKLILGSANITSRGVGEKGLFNFELNSLIESISINDIIYLNSIINNSQYVSDVLYEEIMDLVKEGKMIEDVKYPKLETEKKTIDHFLISQLPMSKTIDELFDGYKNLKSFSEDTLFIAHDISLYNIPLNLTKEDFFYHLKKEFNSHPFIFELKHAIKTSPRKSLNYGSIVNWIRNNTTSVPTPRNWELKERQIVNILYEWICCFDEDYTWDTPNHSEVIHYQKSK